MNFCISIVTEPNTYGDMANVLFVIDLSKEGVVPEFLNSIPEGQHLFQEDDSDVPDDFFQRAVYAEPVSMPCVVEGFISLCFDRDLNLRSAHIKY